MFSVQEFIRLLNIEQNVIKLQTEGLTQDDTLLQPQPSGNCMNWVLGHMLENQVSILNLLGIESPIDEAELEPYQTDSHPITANSSGILPLEHLLAGHTKVHAQVIDRLAKMDPAELDREIQFRDRQVAVSWRLLFLHFHYTYHLGQLELLRQLAGKSEKLI